MWYLRLCGFIPTLSKLFITKHQYLALMPMAPVLAEHRLNNTIQKYRHPECSEDLLSNSTERLVHPQKTVSLLTSRDFNVYTNNVELIIDVADNK